MTSSVVHLWRLLKWGRTLARHGALTGIEADPATPPQVRRLARIARIGYHEGKFGQLDLLDAERTLSETRTAAIDALATYHDAKARLERLTAAAPELAKDQ